MEVVLFTLLAFALGSLPLAWRLGRLVLHVDPRDYGRDHNPGAGNFWRAGGWRVGMAAAALDVGKAVAAIALARAAGLAGWTLFPVGLAPLLGHAFTPVLHGHGGKSVSTTFGVWIGLLGLWAGGLALALADLAVLGWTNRKELRERPHLRRLTPAHRAS